MNCLWPLQILNLGPHLSAAVNKEIWYGVNPKLQLFWASGSTKYTSFIDIDIGIKELIIKTHLSITIRLLRQLSKPNRYVTFFLGHPVDKSSLSSVSKVFGWFSMTARCSNDNWTTTSHSLVIQNITKWSNSFTFDFASSFGWDVLALRAKPQA